MESVPNSSGLAYNITIGKVGSKGGLYETTDSDPRIEIYPNGLFLSEEYLTDMSQYTIKCEIIDETSTVVGLV